MFKVLSLVPKSRIERFGVKPPAGVEITFLEPPFTDDEVIEAGKGADCIFVSGQWGSWLTHYIALWSLAVYIKHMITSPGHGSCLELPGLYICLTLFSW